MSQPLITFASDFGIQSQGIAMMEGIVFKINPNAKIIHLMHGLPSFDLLYAARTLETIRYIPVGFHVCVVDPGVGTKRKPTIIQTGRGDFLVGPDNGVLLPATRFLGGIKRAVEITNEDYMNKPVSPIFHGRDIFAPAAAYLSKGIRLKEFGKELNPKELVKSPYDEAIVKGNEIQAKTISINKFGSLHLNITHEAWDKFNLRLNDFVNFIVKKQNKKIKNIAMPYATTFGDVGIGKPLIIKDDYGRVEVALNQDSFAKKYKVEIGDGVVIKKQAKKSISFK